MVDGVIMKEKVFIIIVNFNGVRDTLECLRSLEKIKIDGLDVNIVVVDNGSSDDSVAKLQRYNAKINLIASPKNVGFAEGNNLGIRYALTNGADFVCLLNNDTLAAADFLKELVDIAKDAEVGISVPKIYFARGYEFHRDRYRKSDLGKVIWYAGGKIDWDNVYGVHRGVDQVDKGQYDKEEETEFASGCCLLIKKEVLDKVGLFDKRYFLYYEDSDFSVRVKKAGYKIVYNPKAVIWHKNAQSCSGGSGGRLQDYYITRNRLTFGLRYAPFRSKLALIRESMRLLMTGSKEQKRGVVDFYLFN